MPNDDNSTNTLSESPNSSDSLAMSTISTVTDLIGDVALPAPIKRNALKAFSRLCSAMIDVPIAALEGRVAELRATTEGRVKIISAATGQIINGMHVGAEYADAAVKRYAAKIVREQVNLDNVTKTASQELRTQDQNTTHADETSIIDDDWLTAFEREAGEKSTAEMQMLFGRILAGEIRRPKSFAIRTLRLISQIDSDTANTFKRLCSVAVSLRVGANLWDARVCSLQGNANTNALRAYGLSYDQLNVLNEFGLITADFNSNMSYEPCVAKDLTVAGLMRFEGKDRYLEETVPRPTDAKIVFNGVALTRAGRELMGIVDIEPDEQYRVAFEQYLLSNQLKLREFSTSS